MQPDTLPPTSDEAERAGGGCRKVIKWTAIVIGAIFALGVGLSLVSGDDDLTTLAEEATSGEVNTDQATTTTMGGLSATTTVPVEDCEPRTEDGRWLTDEEWALLSAVLSDEDRQVSREGVIGRVEGFFSWCELRDHPEYSTGYWLIADDVDGWVRMAMVVCKKADTGAWICDTSSATTTTTATRVDYSATSVSGSGQRVADLEIVGGGLCTMAMTVEENIDDSFGANIDSNFAVTQVDPPGGFDSLWVNVIAASGTWRRLSATKGVTAGP